MKIAGLAFLLILVVGSTLLCLSEMKEEDEIYRDIMSDNHDVNK